MGNIEEPTEELDPEAQRIGATIRSLRKAHRLTQVHLSKAAGCTQGYLSKIERGQTRAPLDLCEAIAEALDVPLTAIVTPEPAGLKAGA